jgi:hypothetical protein
LVSPLIACVGERDGDEWEDIVLDAYNGLQYRTKSKIKKKFTLAIRDLDTNSKWHDEQRIMYDNGKRYERD